MKKVFKKLIVKDALSSRQIKWNKDINNTFNLLPSDIKNIFKNIDQNNIIDGFDIISKIDKYITRNTNKDFIKFIKNGMNKLKNNINNDPIISDVMNILNSISNKSYIVGGAIRDTFNGIPPKDYDIVTDINIDKMINIFTSNGYKCDTIGAHFGVLMISKDGIDIEIANFRKDIYHHFNGKGCDSIDIDTLNDDANRRDFTINAIYFNPITNELIDGSGDGLMDLFNRRFKFIGNPIDRINEDVLRILRVYKFMNKGFIPYNKTLESARNQFHKLMTLGHPDRVRNEMEKLILIGGIK